MVDITTEIENLPPLPDHDWEKNVPYLYKGLGVVIEYLAGDIRTKRNDGVTFSNTMPCAYGYILRTTDVHGEEIDVYIANMPHADALVYVIDQVCPSTCMFDEHKVMLGFESIEEVITTYNEVFGDGSGEKRLGAITTFPGDTIHEWFNSPGYALLPASKYTIDGVTTVVKAGIVPPRPNPKSLPARRDEAGGIVVELPDLSNGPKLTVKVDENRHNHYTLNLFGPIDMLYWSGVVDVFVRTLDFAKETDVVHIRISSPGGSVHTMGRICSAIKATKAKVITYAQGSVASAATTVWVSGHERHILPGSYFMQHMSSQLLGGKTTDIKAKSAFCLEYIDRQLRPLIEIGIFNEEDVQAMIEASADIYVSGRKAIERIRAKKAPAV